MRAAAPLLIALLAVLAAAPAALGLVDPARVGDRPVVVEDGAALSSADRSRLEDAAARLERRGMPTTFVIVAERPPDPEAYAIRVRRESGLPGSVLALYRAEDGGGSLGIASARRGAAAAAFAAERDTLSRDPIEGVIAVAERLASAGDAGAPGDDGGTSTGGWVFLGLIGAGVVGGVALSRRRARERAGRRRQEERAALEPLVDALAAKVTALEGDLPMAPAERAAASRADHEAAVLAYGEAQDLLRRADAAGPDGGATDAARGALERGLRAAARAEAALEGRPTAEADAEPLLRGLCAFDPRHGRAVTTSTVTTPAGDDADIPVCEACAAGLARGEQPDPRRVPAGGRLVPYWQGAGLAGFGGVLFPVLGGLMLYDLLTPGFGFGAGYMGAGEDLGGGGDFGGFGGGDFGGGFGGGGGF